MPSIQVLEMPVTIILICMVILGSTLYLTSFRENYSEDIDMTGLNKTEARLEAQLEIANQTREAIAGLTLKEGGTSAFLIPYQMIKVGWNILKLGWNSIWTLEAILVDMVNIIAEVFSIPSWVISSIVAIIVFSAAAGLTAIFFKWKTSKG